MNSSVKEALDRIKVRSAVSLPARLAHEITVLDREFRLRNFKWKDAAEYLGVNLNSLYRARQPARDLYALWIANGDIEPTDRQSEVTVPATITTGGSEYGEKNNSVRPVSDALRALKESNLEKFKK